MERNAQVKLITLIVYIFSLVITGGCGPKKAIKPNSSKETETIQIAEPAAKTTKDALSKLNSKECGDINLNSNYRGNIISVNLETFQCLKKSQALSPHYKNVFRDVFFSQNFETSVDYIYFLPFINEFNDEYTFQNSIELLQYNYKPESSDGCSTYAPVFEYVNDQLIMPHIKLIDGKPPQEYFEKDQMRYLFNQRYIDHMNYYHQMKDLWESGRITLTSE